MLQQPDGLFFISHQEIDFISWDACLVQTYENIIYASAWYLHVISPGWVAIVEINNGEYVSLLPLPRKKILSFCQVYQPFWCQQLGLFTSARSQYHKLTDYLALIPEQYQKVYLQLNTGNTEAAKLPESVGFTTRQRLTHHLLLNKTYEDLYAAYSSNQKRNLKKASLLQVTIANNITDLISLFRNSKGQEVPELKTVDYNRLAMLYQELKARRAGQVLEVRQNDRLLAAALFLSCKDKIIYLFGASSPAGRRAGAMTKLLDFVIQENAGSEKVLDFEGSDKPLLAKFYLNFGARPAPYVCLTRNTLPWYLKWLIQ